MKITTLLLAAALTLTTTTRAEPHRYEIDPEHLSIGFLVWHIGYDRVLGMFLEGGGSYSFDEQTQQLSELRFTVETDSVFTNHDRRDEHLRSPDFLNSAEFPQMTFTAQKAEPLGKGRFQIPGQLTLLGVTRPVTLTASWNKSAEYPIGGGLFGGKPYVMGVSVRGSFSRSDFGMSYGVNNGLVGDQVELLIELEARRQD